MISFPAKKNEYFFCEETQQWHGPEKVTVEWPVLLEKTQEVVTSDVVVASSSLIALISLAVLMNPNLLRFVRKKKIFAFVKNRHQKAAYHSSSSTASRFTEKAKVPKIHTFPKGLCNRKFKQFLNRLVFADFFKYSCDKFNAPRVSAKFMPFPCPGIRSGALQPVPGMSKKVISTLTGIPISVFKGTKFVGGFTAGKLADLFLILGGAQVLDENLKIVDSPKKPWTLTEKVFLVIIVFLLLKILVLEIWLWDKDLTIVDKDVRITHLYTIINQLLRDLHKLWFKVKNC